MRSYRKRALTCAMVTVFILFSYTFSFALKAEIKGVQFKDGSIVYGVIVEMNADKIVIATKDNQIVTRKYDDIASFIEYDADRSKHSLAFGTEIFHITYEEPGFMKDKGVMYGLFFSYAYHDKLMAKLEGKFAYGEVDYEGGTWGGDPLSVKSIPNFLAEVRGLLGYDFDIVKNSLTISPYSGVGYRYLQDNMQDRYSYGYQREANYLYIPVGVETVARLGLGWSMGAMAEFDIFVWGRQISYFSDIDMYFWATENEQMKGYGARGSLFLAKKFDKAGFMIEPYIRYWDIDESREGYIVYGGYLVGYGIEPKNNSTEIGCRLAVTF